MLVLKVKEGQGLQIGPDVHVQLIGSSTPDFQLTHRIAIEAPDTMLIERTRDRVPIKKRTPMTMVYIAGPMTGLPLKNYPAFHAAAAVLRAEGFLVISPAEIHGDAELSYEEYLRIDCREMLACQQVFALPGWQNSKGARIEVTLALDTSILVHCFQTRTVIGWNGRPLTPNP